HQSSKVTTPASSASTGRLVMDHIRRSAGRWSRRQVLRSSLGLTSLGLLVGCQALPFWAAPPPRVPRIGVLWPGTASDTHLAAFRQGLHDFGYTEGQNLTVDWRFADGQADRYVPLATELAGLPLDVMVTSPPTVKPAQQATTTIPIVFGPLGDPV